MSVGEDSEILGGSPVGAGTPAPDIPAPPETTSRALYEQPATSNMAVYGGAGVAPQDVAFQAAVAARESGTFLGSVTVAASLGARGDAIASNPNNPAANFYTGGSTNLANVASAPYSPQQVIDRAQAGQAMPARGITLADGSVVSATKAQGGQAIQYEPLAATGKGVNNAAFRDILLGNLDEGRGYDNPDVESAAERGLQAAELANLAASYGLDLSMGAINFGNSAGMASKAGATNFAQISDQFYGGGRGLPTPGIASFAGGAATQQAAINAAAFAQIAGVELSSVYQRELESYGATPDRVSAALPSLGAAIEAHFNSPVDRGPDLAPPDGSDPTTQEQVDLGYGGYGNPTGGGLQGSTAAGPNFSNFYGGQGIVPEAPPFDASRFDDAPGAYNSPISLDPWGQEQGAYGGTAGFSNPSVAGNIDFGAASPQFDASRFSDVPSPQTSIGFGLGFGGLGGLDENGNPSAGGFGASGAAFNGGITPEAPAAAVSTGISGREQGAYGGTPTFGQGLNFDTGLASALGLSPEDVAGLSTGGFGLSPNDVGGRLASGLGLGPDDAGGLSSNNIGGLSPNDVGGLSTGGYGNSPNDVGGLSSNNVGGLSPNDVGGMSAGGLGLSPNDVGGAVQQGASPSVGLGYQGPQSGAFGGAATFGQGLDLNGGPSSNGAPDITVTPADGLSPGNNYSGAPSAVESQVINAGGLAPDSHPSGSRGDNPLASTTHDLVAGGPFASITPDMPAGMLHGVADVSAWPGAVPLDISGAFGHGASTALGPNFGSFYGPDAQAPSSNVSTDITGREQGAYGGAATFGQGLDLNPGQPAALGGLSPDVASIFSPSVMDQGALGTPSFGQPATALGSNFGSSYPGSGVVDLGYGSAGPSGGFANVAGFNQAPGGAVVSNGAPPGLDPSVWAGANGLLTNMGMGSVGTQVASNTPGGITPDITVTPSDNFGTPPSSMGTFDYGPAMQNEQQLAGVMAGLAASGFAAPQFAEFSPNVTGQGTFGASTFNPGAVGFAGSPSGFSTSPTVDNFSGGPQARPDFGYGGGQTATSTPNVGPSTDPNVFLGPQDFGAGLGAPGVAGYGGVNLGAGLGGGIGTPVAGGGLSFADDATSGRTSLFDFAPPDSQEQTGVPAGFEGLASMGLSAADLGITSNSPEGPPTGSVGSVQGAIAAEGGVGNIAATSGGFPDPAGLAAAQESAAANQAAVASNPSTTANAQSVADAAAAASAADVAAEAGAAMGGFSGSAGGPGQAAEGGTTSSADAGNNGGPGGFSGTGEGNDSGAGGGPGGAGSGASGTGSGSGSAGGSGDAGGNGGGAGSASGGESGSAGGGGDSGSY